MSRAPLAGDSGLRRRRLYWQCRRGMRELDLLLQGFLETGFDRLTETEQKAFEDLLGLPDQLLLAYLMGRQRPPQSALAHVVQQIRRHVAH